MSIKQAIEAEATMDDPNMHAYGDHYQDFVADILLDVCELEPANSELTDTLCVSVEDLKIILNRHLAALRSMPAEPVEAAAWMHHDDPRRVISGLQKSDAVAAGGASASSVALYDIPLIHQHEATPHTAPVPLSDAEIVKIAREVLERQTEDGTPPAFQLAVGVAQAIERAVLGRGEK